MSWILSAGYCGLLWLVFAKFKLLKLSLPIATVAASVGPTLIVALLFCAQYYHPLTYNAITFQQVVPIAAGVSKRGHVVNLQLREGMMVGAVSGPVLKAECDT